MWKVISNNGFALQCKFALLVNFPASHFRYERWPINNFNGHDSESIGHCSSKLLFSIRCLFGRHCDCVIKLPLIELSIFRIKHNARLEFGGQLRQPLALPNKFNYMNFVFNCLTQNMAERRARFNFISQQPYFISQFHEISSFQPSPSVCKV